VAGPERRLIVLRHAKSAWPEGVPDHDRPLAPRGRRDAPAAGRWLRKSGLVPDRVICSTAERARETWQLAEEKLGAHPETVFDERVYGATSAELLALARRAPAGVRTLLIVGHDPAMHELTLDLAGPPPDGKSRDALDRVQIKFPTAAIAVLEFAGAWSKLGPGEARLADFAVPGDFRSRSGGS
jgi:phosphohistidine phosphatase